MGRLKAGLGVTLILVVVVIALLGRSSASAGATPGVATDVPTRPVQIHTILFPVGNDSATKQPLYQNAEATANGFAKNVVGSGGDVVDIQLVSVDQNYDAYIVTYRPAH